MIQKFAFELAPGISLGEEKPILIAGPCVVEAANITLYTAKFLRDLTSDLGISFIFKSSFDKANRTSSGSFRSVGFESALEILGQVRAELNVPVLTDVHETNQVDQVAKAVDVLQIPAFLCRQTDLIQKAGSTGLPIKPPAKSISSSPSSAMPVELME